MHVCPARSLALLRALAIGLVLLWSMPGVAAADTQVFTVTAPDGTRIAAQAQGSRDGPVVVFVHGLLGSRLNWQAQLSSPQLAHHRLVSYDLRGHGLSGRPTEPGAYRDGRRWADDLAAVIEATGADKVTLVGWSLGGMVISNYLAVHGDDKLAGVVYVDGVIELAAEQIVPHPAVYRDLVSPDLGTHLGAIRTFLDLCFATRPPAALFETLLASAAMASWSMQQHVQSMTVDLTGLEGTDVPVMLLYGARDALVDTGAAVRRARQLHPAADVKIYEAAGHAPFLEEAERFNRDLSAFVAKTQRAH